MYFYMLHITISYHGNTSFLRFYIDRSGDDPLAGLSEEDKARVNLRSQRFAKGSEGNRTFKQKMSIQDMIKTVVCSVCDSKVQWKLSQDIWPNHM